MTAPTQTHEVAIDDIEQSLQQPTSKVTDTKLDGEGIPDEFKGKTVAELIAMQQGLAQSLKLSELGRADALARATQPAPAAPKAPEPEPEMTDEQLAELYQENPILAMRKVQEQAVRLAQRNLEARVGGLAPSIASTIESQMRAKYPDEFAALGSEISSLIEQRIPDKSQLSDPNLWEEMIRYVRGANFDKMVEFKQQKNGRAALSAARAIQDAAAGLSFAPSGSQPISSAADDQADEYTREIAKNLGMSVAEYNKWKRI